MQREESNFIAVKVFGLLLLKYLGCLGNSYPPNYRIFSSWSQKHRFGDIFH